MAPDDVLALAKVLESLDKAPNKVFDVIYVVPTETPEYIEEALGQKMAIFKYHQNTTCGYSKLVPKDA